MNEQNFQRRTCAPIGQDAGTLICSFGPHVLATLAIVHSRPNSENCYRASTVLANKANNPAGPGYTSTQPAFRNETSANPPQRTPIVATCAFAAASTS